MLQTFLSEEVYNFIQLWGSAESDSVSKNTFISSNLNINWTKIESIFSDCLELDENFIIQEQSDEWFRLKIKLIHRIMLEASINLKEATEEIISHLWDRCSWSDRITDITKCYEYFKSNDQSDLLKSVLILTSIIERALGNVYRMDSKNVPFLLKDLLETKYLYSLLGSAAIRLMQILFGSSKALNIRNIAWHGFLSVNELNQNHIGILFILIASIGDILNQQNVEISSIPYRPQITNLEQKINEIEARNKFIDLFNFTEDVKEIMQNCDTLIGPTHSEFWNKIVSHTPENCTNNCLILLLPIFEHLFRRIFCKINCCDDRAMTALKKEKYTTLDEIFAENLNENPNKMFDVLNQGAVNFYLDLFSHLSGPRIRDKFSHAEIVLQSVPCRITEILLNLIVYSVLETNINELHTDIKQELWRNFEKYESLYHPNTILKYKIIDACNNINKMLHISKPTKNEIEKTEIYSKNIAFHKIIDKCSKIFNSNIEIYVQNLKFPTLFRPKEELKLIKKLTQITTKIIDISQQIISDNADRYKSFTDKTLSSRQINRYDEILQSISIVHESLNCILHVIVLLLHKQFLHNEDFKFDKHMFRFLRSTLNYEDKIERFSSVKINKWMKVRTLTDEYEKQLNCIFKKI